jgi:hypothetical protein
MSFSQQVALRFQSHNFQAAHGQDPRCAVCHGREVMRDEVFDAGSLQLCECRHCEHRWTFRPSTDQAERSRRPLKAERSMKVQRSAAAVGVRQTGLVHAA